MNSYDAVIVGSGPNGLSAAIHLAQSGCSVLVLEGNDRIGGGVRSSYLTRPGFIHDDCASIFPLTLASPFFRTLPLQDFGLEWIYPEFQLAHPLDDGSAIVIDRSLEETARLLTGDEGSYRRLMAPLLNNWERFVEDLLGPLPMPPRAAMTFIQFGLGALRSARSLAKSTFQGERGRALFAGMSAHGILPLDTPSSGAYGIVLPLLAHAVGWPMPRGGAQNISNALYTYFLSLGGEVTTSTFIESINQLPDARAYLFDVSPRSLLKLFGDKFPAGYRRQLERYRYGPGVFKVDFALSEPVPWIAPECHTAGTVHLGGTLEEITTSERLVGKGQHPEHPFILVAQHSKFDPGRAPENQHTLWTYCHVPNGSTHDMTERIISQIERFAPGFRHIILDLHTRNAMQTEAYNPNYVGGDINVGVQDLWQLYARPAIRLEPYTTPLNHVFLCSSATPPGGGVHGMCGYYAARSALRFLEG
ncbi:MAG: FAD-dependent oxidoreductase [Chloroflexi bacterium RBG_16_54_18]|nr:MAG: FAD-dependent oxidoreductase [Chloroflexi bacterium RBG_16_54_18]